MPKKTRIAFLGVEKWEQDYLRRKLGVERNLSLVFFSKSLNSPILKKIGNADILVVFVWSQVDGQVISCLPRLKFIATMSTGFDHIDLEACEKRGIKVSNLPFYGSKTVAEHTFALLLSLSRKIPQSIARTRQGNFTLEGLRGFDLEGKTIGIVGLGQIGSEVAKLASGFGMRILAFDPKKNPVFAKKWKIKYTTLDYLLESADIISLHTSYNEKTHHLINKGNIRKIKKGAYLINTARGGLVETEALLLALKRGILAGVGLDVLEEECFIKEEKELLTRPFQKTCDLRVVLHNHLLIHNPKVIITPHNAFNSKEALQRILDTTIENIKAFLKGKPLNLLR